MESKDMAELCAAGGVAEDVSTVQDSEPMQGIGETEGEPEVIELAGQVKQALAPVRAPLSVREKLRVELLDIAQHRQCQDLRIETPSRHREWAIGAAIGSAMALAGGVLYLLRSRISGKQSGTDS